MDSLFYVPSIVCGGSEVSLCFVMHYFVSFLVSIILPRNIDLEMAAFLELTS